MYVYSNNCIGDSTKTTHLCGENKRRDHTGNGRKINHEENEKAQMI